MCLGGGFLLPNSGLALDKWGAYNARGTILRGEANVVMANARAAKGARFDVAVQVFQAALAVVKASPRACLLRQAQSASSDVSHQRHRSQPGNARGPAYQLKQPTLPQHRQARAGDRNQPASTGATDLRPSRPVVQINPTPACLSRTADNNALVIRWQGTQRCRQPPLQCPRPDTPCPRQSVPFDSLNHRLYPLKSDPSTKPQNPNPTLSNLKTPL